MQILRHLIGRTAACMGGSNPGILRDDHSFGAEMASLTVVQINRWKHVGVKPSGSVTSLDCSLQGVLVSRQGWHEVRLLDDKAVTRRSCVRETGGKRAGQATWRLPWQKSWNLPGALSWKLSIWFCGCPVYIFTTKWLRQEESETLTLFGGWGTLSVSIVQAETWT